MTENAESVRRYDGGTEHADWCPDREHQGMCLDAYLVRVGVEPVPNDGSGAKEEV